MQQLLHPTGPQGPDRQAPSSRLPSTPAPGAPVSPPNFTKMLGGYVDDVLSGKIEACKWVKLACTRHQNDLLRAESDPSFPYRFEPALVERVCRFGSKMRHVKGKWAGERIKLEPWQVFILGSIFGWVRKSDGTRRFREAFITVCRKNGKSLLAAIVGLYMLVGDGEKGSEIYSGATSLDQALEVFRPAWLMVERDAAFRQHFGLELGGTTKNPKTVYRLSDSSRFEPVIGKPGDGASPSCGIVDEYHEHHTPDLYDTLLTGMGARSQPLLFIITTAGVDTSVPCYDKQKDAQKVLEGVIEQDDSFCIIYTIDTSPYTVAIKSFEDGKRLIEEKCTCGRVKITQTSPSELKGCAPHAMQSGSMSNTQIGGVKTTQIGTQATTAYAGPVTSSTYSTETQNTERANSQNGQSGQEKTEINAPPLTDDGRKTAAKKECTSRGLVKNTEYLKKNTPICEISRAVSAPYVGEAVGSVSTTVTSQERYGGFSAKSVTQESDFWGTLKQEYFAHSSTCGVRNLKLSDEDRSFTYPPDDWTDFNCWKKANPNFGVSIYEDFLRARHKEAMSNPARKPILLTKHLDLWQNAGQAWMDMLKWAACEDSCLTLEDFEGQDCWLGLDLANKIDIAALRVVFRHKGGYAGFGFYYLPHDRIWAPENTHYQQWLEQGHIIETDGATTDFLRIRDDIQALCQRFNVKELAYDPKEASYFIMDLQQQEWASLDCVEIVQSPINISEPTKSFEALIYSGDYRHNGDPVMTWMMSNVVLKQARSGGPIKVYYPTKERNTAKIDGPMAEIMALSRAIVATPQNTDLFLDW